VVGLATYAGCVASLVVMAVFSSHSDVLFRIGFPATEKATLYLTPAGALVWSAVGVYRMYREGRHA